MTWAQPTVTFNPAQNDDGSISGDAFIDEVDGKWELRIFKFYKEETSPFTITIGASQNEPIRFITIDQKAYTTGNLVYVHSHSQYNPCGDVGHIKAIGSVPISLSRLFMNGTLGTAPYTGQVVIEGFDTVGGLEITGDVYGDIVTTGDHQNSIWEFKGDVHGNLIALDGYHRDIKILTSGASGGNLYGDIIAENGWISSLIVDESIGSPGSPVNIWSRASLVYLECQDLYANIDTTLYGLSAAIYELRVESGDPTRGNFDGTIRCGYVVKDGNEGTGDFVITGDVLGEINVDRTFLEDITFGTLTTDEGEPFFIGRDLTSDCLARFTDPLGLQGQVIINGHNGTYGWNGVVEYYKDGGFIPLAPVPYYNNRSVDFGGGAVGLVRYYLHYADSQPSGTKVDQGDDGHENGLGECEEGYQALKKVHPAWSLPKVTLRHYGPILQVGTGKPFTIKRKTIYTLSCDAGGNPNWADVTANFTHSFPVNENRAIEINGSFDPGYDYLIEPKVDENGSDYLYCGGLDPLIDNVPIMDYDYRLRVIVAPDITGNGLLEPDHIPAWLLDPQDANLDGYTDNHDLMEVIDAVAEYGE